MASKDRDVAQDRSAGGRDWVGVIGGHIRCFEYDTMIVSLLCVVGVARLLRCKKGEEESVATLVEIPLDGGGSILVEAAPGFEGPVKAGRVGDAIHALPTSLREALRPVVQMAHTVVEELRAAGPTEWQVEFGVDLSVAAGAVVTKTGLAGHLKVVMTWKGGAHGQSAGEA